MLLIKETEQWLGNVDSTLLVPEEPWSSGRVVACEARGRGHGLDSSSDQMVFLSSSIRR